MLEKNDAPPAEKGRRADGDFLAVFLSSNKFATAGASGSWRRASATSTVTSCAGAAGNQLTEVERA
jgi:hypothetical protein